MQKKTCTQRKEWRGRGKGRGEKERQGEGKRKGERDEMRAMNIFTSSSG